jgi:hypothetical protein
MVFPKIGESVWKDKKGALAIRLIFSEFLFFFFQGG